MEAQHAQRVVFKRYLYRGYARATIHRESVHQISGLYKHSQQQFSKWNNACACHNVCECVYHHYQTGLLYATYKYNMHLVSASLLCT